MVYRGSFSQAWKFNNCAREWYYGKILNINVPGGDMSYANAGNVVHKTLEHHYDDHKLTMEQCKIRFEDMWCHGIDDKNRFDLSQSILKNKKDEYWLMVVRGINLKLKVTSTEFKVFMENFLGYYDMINTEDDIIMDWKTSKRDKEHDFEYSMQLKLYAYFYHQKFKRYPKQLIIYYVKFDGSQMIYEVPFTEKDIQDTFEWYNTIIKQMEIYSDKKQLPDCAKECSLYCPYKNICFNPNTYTLHNYGSYVYIEGKITELLHRGLDKKFTYTLKDRYLSKTLGKEIKHTTRFWSPKTQTLPIGFITQVKKTLSDYLAHMKLTGDVIVKDHIVTHVSDMTMPIKNNKELRDYQKEAVNIFLENKIGILNCTTGSGKTEIATEVIRITNLNTLFIVDRKELLMQTIQRIKDNLGIDVGQIGVMDIKQVNVATIQTLNSKSDELKEYFRTVNFVIYDEMHKIATESYKKVSRYFINTTHRLGITGTAYRDDGKDMDLVSICGDIIYKLDAQELIDAGFLIKPTINFITNYLNEFDIVTYNNLCSDNYSETYKNCIVHNGQRNLIIKNMAMIYNKNVLIIVKAVEHGEILQQMIPNSKYLHGSLDTETRTEMMKDIKSQKLKVLIATNSICSEGLDIPNLAVIINASANSGKVKTVQSLGRILRLFTDKTECFYYDFNDPFKTFKYASYKRTRAFREEGHTVNKIEV